MDKKIELPDRDGWNVVVVKRKEGEGITVGDYQVSFQKVVGGRAIQMLVFKPANVQVLRVDNKSNLQSKQKEE